MTQPFPLLPPLSFLAVLSLPFLTGMGISPPEKIWNYRCLYRWVLEKFRHKHHFSFIWNEKVNFPPNFLIFVIPRILWRILRWAFGRPWAQAFLYVNDTAFCATSGTYVAARGNMPPSVYNVKNYLLHLLTVFFEWLVGWLVGWLVATRTFTS